MIAAAAPIRRRRVRTRPQNGLVALQQRTERLLSHEIPFIPNPVFRELDTDPAWRDEPIRPATSPESEPLDQPWRGRTRMPAHLERLCSAPLLSPEQERDLFCRMNYLKYRANLLRVTLNAQRPSERKLARIEYLLREGIRVRNEIVHANIRLVVSIVKQFADERNSFDDLLSEGINCLIKAVDKFDFDRGFRFSTYATRAVRREVFRLVQKQYRDRVRFTTGASEVLSEQLDAEPETERSETYMRQRDRALGGMLSRLDQRERFIVQARYGFRDLGEKPTFQRLGELLGVSKERVRQLEQRALGKLRELADSLHLEPGF